MRLKEIKPGMIIHCKTEEEAKALHAELCRLGNMSTDLDALLNFINIKNLYYAILDLNAKTWRFSNEYEFETRNGIEFSDLIIPELSAKEVLETMKEICKHHDCQCHRCSFRGNCDPTEDSSDKIIDICTKWREEHPKEEKKELETEWVYVVRIIKVHDNGKKECVHEVDYEPNKEYNFVEDFLMAKLKEYCSEHEGNFFAVYERVCRIKE